MRKATEVSGPLEVSACSEAMIQQAIGTDNLHMQAGIELRRLFYPPPICEQIISTITLEACFAGTGKVTRGQHLSLMLKGLVRQMGARVTAWYTVREQSQTWFLRLLP